VIVNDVAAAEVVVGGEGVGDPGEVVAYGFGGLRVVPGTFDVAGGVTGGEQSDVVPSLSEPTGQRVDHQLDASIRNWWDRRPG
jgi:hypothetical protein